MNLCTALRASFLFLFVSALHGTPAGAVERVDVSEVITSVSGDEIDLEILPKPRLERYSGKALRMDAVSIDFGGAEDTPAARLLGSLLPEWGVKISTGARGRIVLRLIDPPSGWGPDPAQGYRLAVRAGGGGVLVEISGGGKPGLFYGVQTLRQLVHVRDGAVWVREAEIEDWPSVRYRGPAGTEGARWKQNLHVIRTSWPPDDPNAGRRGAIRTRRRQLKEQIGKLKDQIDELQPASEEDASDDMDALLALDDEQDDEHDVMDSVLLRQSRQRLAGAERELERLAREEKSLEAAYKEHKRKELESIRELVPRLHDSHITPVVFYQAGCWTWGRHPVDTTYTSYKRYIERLLENVESTYRVWHEHGVRKFMLSFSLGGYYQMKRSEALMPMAVPEFGEVQAQVTRRVRRFLDELGPENRFILGHQKHSVRIHPGTRHVMNWRLKRDPDDLAAEFVAAGPPGEMEIRWLGSGDPTPLVTAGHAEIMSEVFGGRRAAFLHMGPGRIDASYGPRGNFIGNALMEPHEPDLAEHLDFANISGWAGRQWGWHAKGYDPELATAVMVREMVRNAGGGPDAYRPLLELAMWQRENAHYAIVGRGWHAVPMLAENQNALSPQEAEALMEKKHRLYDTRIAALREALPPDGGELADRIENEASARMDYLERVAGVLKARRTAVGVRTETPVELDGRLNEPAWAQAPQHGRFKGTRRTDDEHAWVEAGLDTTFRVLYDDDNLYVAVWCEEPDVAGISAGRESDYRAVYGGDHLQLVIDHTGRKERATYLTTTIHGQSIVGNLGHWEYFVDPGPLHDWQWPRDFRVAAVGGDGGWGAEFAIPLEDIDQKYRPAPGRRWGFNVIRRRAGGGGPGPGVFQNRFSWQRTATDRDHDRDGPSYRGQIIYIGTLVFE